MTTPNGTDAESKRLSSVKQKIKAYNEQQKAIKIALGQLDQKCNKKIIFDDDNNETQLNSVNSEKRQPLFGSDSEEEDNYNFEPKNQFLGKDGQKLLELQTKYKGDKRFILNERFIDENEDSEKPNSNFIEEGTLEEEKEKELNILEELLGTKVKKRHAKLENTESPKKKMLRFDPDLPDHLKFEAKPETPAPKKQKNKQKDSKLEDQDKNEEQPLVSKDVFYKVSDDLKNVLQEKENFSLLNLFGQQDDKEQVEEAPEEEKIISNQAPMENNPFRYDSSDEEDVVDETVTNNQENNTETNDVNLWNNVQFFFKEDDFRLQEGEDFVRRIASEQNPEFATQRRNLKHLVKTKMRNIQKKKNPFKKKLGGSKKKKMLRIKKAMKK